MNEHPHSPTLPAAQGYVVENGVRQAPLAVVAMAQTILCPRCGLRQTAYVTKHPLAFWLTYVHVCLRCEYVITESEWREVS